MKTPHLLAAGLAAGLAAALLGPLASFASPADPDLTATVQYSDDPDFTATFNGPPATWDAPSGTPDDLTFTDHGDNTATLSGQTRVTPGVYDIDLTATTSSATFPYTLALTVTPEKAVVRMASTNPTTVRRTKSFVVKARVQDQDDDSPGDITQALLGSFTLTRNGHVRTFGAAMVPNSLHTTAPAYYDVRATVPSGLRRGTWTVQYAVTGDYYTGSRTSQVQITR